MTTNTDSDRFAALPNPDRRAVFIAAATGLDVDAVKAVFAAKLEYDGLFAYKCSDSFCPLLKAWRREHPESVSTPGRMLRPGYPSGAALLDHLETEHTTHVVADMHYNGFGVTHIYCSCGHSDPLRDKDDNGRFPDGRLDHIRRVLTANPDAKVDPETLRLLNPS